MYKEFGNRLTSLGVAALISLSLCLAPVVKASPISGASVTVTSVSPGTTTTKLGKTEDAAHTSGDVGVEVLGRRIDTMDASSGTSGDYETLNMDSKGRVYIINQVVAGDGDTPGSSLGATSTGTATLAAPLVLTSVQYCNGDSATATGKVYDKATAATGSDTPIFRIRALAGTCTNVQIPTRGVAMANGLSFRAVTENTDAGTTGVAANTAMFNFTYK